MRFKCEHCSAQYQIADEKVGSKGVRVRCKKCGEIITVKPLADEDEASTSASGEGRDDTEVSQSPDGAEVDRDETTVDQPDGEREGFDLGDDEELGSAFDSLLGDENGELDEDGVDYDRQSTRVFNVEEMQKVQEEKDQAALLSDLYHSAQASEAAKTGQTSPGVAAGEDRERVEWYAAVDEQQVGPMNAVELEERLGRSEFDLDTLVWKNGFDDWIPIAEVEAFSHLRMGAAEAPPPAADEKTIAWGREHETEEELDVERALGVSPEEEFAQEGMDDEEAGYGDETEGLYDDEEASADASAAAFAGADVDWKPSAIADLNTLAEEELASLKPPEETESEGEFPFGGDSELGEGEEGVESSDMDDGDSSIIGQIAAEEEAAARRAEEERRAEERRAEEAKRKKEEEDLAAQEAARREREEEQRDRAAPPPEQILQPRSGIPKWAIGAISGVVGVIVLLLGFIAYKLATGSTEPEHKAQPMVPPEAAAAAVHQPTTPPGPAIPPAEEKAPAAPVAETAAAVTSPVATQPTVEEKPAAKTAKAEHATESKPALAKKPASKPAPKKPAASKRRKRKTVAAKEKPIPEVAEPPPIPEPPPPPSEKKKPRRRGEAKDDLLDFDDEKAFAEVTGGQPAARKEEVKPVEKKLPPLSDADVMAVMRNHVPEFKACNRKQQAIDRSVRGKMVVSFTISPNGSVTSATTQTAKFKSTFVSGCITKVIQQLRFPKFGGKPKRVPFPFTVK